MKKKNDVQLIVLSVILAIVMWAFVVTSTNPSVNRTFRNVPILVQNKDALEARGYTIIGLDETSNVNIRVEGTRDKIVGTKQNDIQASIDVKDVKEGIQSVGVKVDTPSGVGISMVDPPSININVQKKVEKSLPINIVIKDSLKHGRSVEINEQSIEEVTVRGPVSAINQIDRVEVNIDEERYLDGKIHNIDIHILDKDGKEVTGIEKSNDDINISFRAEETKRVPIKMSYYGEPAEGFEIKNISLSQTECVIKGDSGSLKSVDEIETYPVNVTELKSEKKGEIKLNIPDGVSLYDGKNPVSYKIEVGRKEK